jgi:hypothetical protein
MAYSTEEDDGPATPEAIDLAWELLSRCQPVTESSPAWKYSTETRGLPDHAVRYCLADLRQLKPPIPGFDRLAYGVVSLLTDMGGEVSGLVVEACGPAGERVLGKDGRTARKSFRLRDRGCAEGLFQIKATTEGAMVAYMTEGHLAKAIAVAAVLSDPVIYGFGGRPSLGVVVPPEMTVVVVADQRPTDPEEAEQHDRDYERGCDRLLLAGRLVRLAEMGCTCCKDLDEAIQRHPQAEVRDWLLHAEAVPLSLDGHARRIAKIKDSLRRGQAIADLAKDLGLRKDGLTGAFRAAVAKYAGDPDREGGEDATRPPPVEDAVPWPHPVDGAEVLDAVVTAITRHVNLPLEAAHAAALWCAHSHALDLAWFNPRLAICSPVKRCGKTTLVEVLSGMVARPKPTSGITPSVVFRMIDKYRPTYLIDEADGYLPENEQLRSVLNSGHTRTAAVVDRTETNADGTREPRSFSTWTPLVVAGIGRLPSTLDDRSIKVRLQRKPRALKLVRFRADRVAGITEIGRKLARFILDNQIAISEADIEPPEELHDRAADNWRPLMAIAASAGGEWPERARAAASALEDAEQAVEDLCVELLADIRRIFQARTDSSKQQALFSTEILSALLAMTDRPWTECGQHGRALTERSMANLLKPFGIKTHKTIRRGKRTSKGYRLDEFTDVFSSYLVSEGAHGSQGHTPGNPPDSGGPDGSHDGSHAGTRPNGAAGGLSDDVSDVSDGVTHDVTHGEASKTAEVRHCAPCDPCDPSETPASETKKPRRRSRIKGADTTPTVDGL